MRSNEHAADDTASDDVDLDDVGSVVSAVVAVAREEQVTVVAAGLAYYAFNSVIPLALLAFVGLSAFGDANPAYSLVRTVAGGGATEVLRDSIGDAQGRTRAVVIAAAMLGWSAVRMFRAVHATFAELYGARKRRTISGKVADVGLVLLTVSAAFGLLAGLGWVLAFVAEAAVWSVLAPVVLFAVLVAVFVPMYYVFPADGVSMREALPGAVFAAAAWTLSGVGFRAYAATAESVQLYGVVAGVLIFLGWLYVGGLVLLVGVVLNAVLAERVSPDYGWLPEWWAISGVEEG